MWSHWLDRIPSMSTTVPQYTYLLSSSETPNSSPTHTLTRHRCDSNPTSSYHHTAIESERQHMTSTSHQQHYLVLHLDLSMGLKFVPWHDQQRKESMNPINGTVGCGHSVFPTYLKHLLLLLTHRPTNSRVVIAWLIFCIVLYDGYTSCGLSFALISI